MNRESSIVRQMVCEGACNPALPQADAAVRRHRDHERPHGPGMDPIPDDLARLLRAASTHTPHEGGWRSWRCQVCGSERV